MRKGQGGAASARKREREGGREGERETDRETDRERERDPRASTSLGSIAEIEIKLKMKRPAAASLLSFTGLF